MGLFLGFGKREGELADEVGGKHDGYIDVIPANVKFKFRFAGIIR